MYDSQPTFYFIGGPPFSGKFEIAQKAAGQKIEIVSTDGLRRVLWANVPEEVDPKLHRLRHAKSRTFSSDADWIDYARSHADEMVEGESEIEAPRVWERGVLPYLDCNFGRGVNTLFQGVHVTPDLVATLRKNYQISAVFVGNSSSEPAPDLIANALKAAHQNPNHWARTWSREKLVAYLSYVVPRSSQRFHDMAAEHGFDYVELSVGDYKAQQQKAAEALVKS